MVHFLLRDWTWRFDKVWEVWRTIIWRTSINLSVKFLNHLGTSSALYISNQPHRANQYGYFDFINLSTAVQLRIWFWEHEFVNKTKHARNAAPTCWRLAAVWAMEHAHNHQWSPTGIGQTFRKRPIGITQHVKQSSFFCKRQIINLKLQHECLAEWTDNEVGAFNF